MNEKIALPSLVALLAVQTGKPKKQCEDFLRVFFNTIVETLSEGENIKIKGVGTFKVVTVESRKSVNVNTGEQIEIPSHNKIVFVPAKELAEEVNAPFAMFDSVEIPGDAGQSEFTDFDDNKIETNEPEISDGQEVNNEYILKQESIESVEECNSEIITEPAKVPTKSIDESVEEPASVEEPYNEQKLELEKENEALNEAVKTDEFAEQELMEEATEETEKIVESGKSYRFLFGFICGVACCALICLAGYLFFFDDLTKLLNSENNTENVTNASADMQKSVMTATPIATPAKDTLQNVVNERISSEAETSDNDIAPTQPSDATVYDVISKTRYLTTMAKEHYGNYNLWPYIYEENKAFLGHPDRIRPGTRVVIPKLSKYGVNPNNPEDIRKAKKKGGQIYSRYQ